MPEWGTYGSVGALGGNSQGDPAWDDPGWSMIRHLFGFGALTQCSSPRTQGSSMFQAGEAGGRASRRKS
jgi:hypothetical protein